MALSATEAFDAIQAHCLAKEGVVEEYPWEDVAWKVGGKMFACGSAGSNAVTVKSTLEKQAALVQHPAIEPAHSVGRYGWVTIRVADAATLDIARDLIDESYEAIRSKRRAPSAGKGKS
jgi:predicted DNA-binding protein (MmcQ/YjbR family)